jgi:CRISPR-associated endonuclease/helicase Cas3
MGLDPSRFPEFFTDVHGFKPFPWQDRLAAQVAQDGAWPELIELPTGAGKTSIVDVALFLQAVRDDQPRRIVFVVDRRIVVHQAARHAEQLRRSLQLGSTTVLAEVAGRLRALAYRGEDLDTPLQVTELRGGIERDEDWARRPDVPAVVVSTVDQVGSRLLFRGYGVSRGMRPVHAGLLGNDVLFVLDEVHLARPFAQTLAAMRARYRGDAAFGVPDRWTVVELSATPPSTPRTVFRLASDDRQSPDLARRLGARKPVALTQVRTTARDPATQRAALAQAAVTAARELLDQDGIRTVGVVVNRVDTAVAIYRQWQDTEKVLLTGRMRPLDRDRLSARYLDRLRTGRPRADDAPPLLVVATQAIEAGADLDLDALVTECAPLDSLIQRFGRVDRDGRLTEAGLHTTSVVLATAAQLKEDDPVYGAALRSTWKWLADNVVDFGPDRLLITAAERASLSSPTTDTPYLLPGHLDRWVQTSHLPDADPVPEFWLHGLREQTPEVSIGWRADLPSALLTADDDDLVGLRALIEACPPGSGELLSVPLSAARRWLSGAVPLGVSDALVDTVDVAAGDSWRPALVFDGDDSRVALSAADLRPNTILVVPAEYGGWCDGTWDPTATEPVPDLGTAAQLPRNAVLRLSPELIGAVPQPDPHDPLTATQARQALRTWLATADPSTDDPATHEVVAILRQAGQRLRVTVVDTAPARQRYVLQSSTRWLEADSEPATSSFLGEATPLADHLDDVEHWAAELSRACGLPDALRDDLALAGALHDLGKADPRFQRMLRAESPAGDGLLAKSGLAASNYRGRRRALLASGYPSGTRHELASVALVANQGWLRDQAHDLDLVLHLIASHHGYARPFLPVPATASPVEITVIHRGYTLSTTSDHGLVSPGGGVPDRFWRCVRRYGWHGLAWLEALLRLADHRASEEGTRPR